MTDTVTVRDMTPADIQSLIEGNPLEAVQHDSFGRFIPVTLNPNRHTITDVHPPLRDENGEVKRTRPGGMVITDKEVVVGQFVRVGTVTAYGAESGACLFTTAEAEQAYADVNDGGRTRETTFAVPDPDGDDTVTMMPVYGSMVTLTVFVRDASPEHALAVAQDAVLAAYPTWDARVASARSRPVADRRVTVAVWPETGPLGVQPVVVARNVLHAEVGYVLNALGHSQHGCQTTAENPAVEVFVGS